MRNVLVVAILFLQCMAVGSPAHAQAPPGKPGFMDVGPQVGDQLSNPEVRTPEGDARELHGALAPRQPTVLLTVSYTCPKSRSTHPAVIQLQKRYGDRVHFAILYVIEAHPQTDVCPYSGKEDLTKENVRDGILRRQPKSFEQRAKLANEFKTSLAAMADIYLDTMDNRAWRSLGGGPNMAFLVDDHGIVHARQGWLNAEKLAGAIDRYLAAQAKVVDDLRDLDVFATLDKLAPFRGRDLEAARKALDADPKLTSWMAATGPGVSGGRSLLMHAVDANAAPIVKLLIDRGADPNFRSAYGETSLHLAAARGRIDVIELLLANGAKVDEPCGRSGALTYGPTPLDEALLRGRRPAAQALFKGGATTGFFASVALGRADVVRAALAKDPTRVDRPDGRGFTPSSTPPAPARST